MAEKTGDEYWFAEVVSFFCRCFGVLAISCVAVGSYEKGTMDYVCLAALAFGFYVNCLEFSRPARENLMIHVGGFALAACTGLLVYLLASQSSPLYGKYYGAFFCSLNALGSSLMSIEFLIYSKN